MEGGSGVEASRTNALTKNEKGRPSVIAIHDGVGLNCIGRNALQHNT